MKEEKVRKKRIKVLKRCLKESKRNYENGYLSKIVYESYKNSIEKELKELEK